MKYQIFSLASLLVVVMLFAACAPQAQVTETPVTPDPIVQSDPTESQASLMIELQQEGMQVELGDPVDQSFFSVQGKIIKVNGADLQVFEYKSVEAMEAEAALVSADGGSVGTSMMMWMATPYFFKSGRVLVLYVGDDTVVLAALQSVLGEQFAGG
jgi:hypothetical protein